jgi:secretion/DNA translocation related TadE-like protein
MRDERGSATVIAMSLLSTLTVAGLVATGIAQQALLRQHLATAADLSAIAAAQSLEEPCFSARKVAEAHFVRLVDCGPRGANWQVEVAMPVGFLAQRLFTFLGRGPSEMSEVAVAGYE